MAEGDRIENVDQPSVLKREDAFAAVAFVEGHARLLAGGLEAKVGRKNNRENNELLFEMNLST